MKKFIKAHLYKVLDEFDENFTKNIPFDMILRKYFKTNKSLGFIQKLLIYRAIRKIINF